MDPAEHLADQPSGIIDEIIRETREEKVGSHDALCHAQPLLSLFEIKIAEQILEEPSDGVRILILLHLDDLRQIPDVIAVAPRPNGFWCAAGDDGGGDEVPEEVRAGCLDGVEIGRG